MKQLIQATYYQVLERLSQNNLFANRQIIVDIITILNKDNYHRCLCKWLNHKQEDFKKIMIIGLSNQASYRTNRNPNYLKILITAPDIAQSMITKMIQTSKKLTIFKDHQGHSIEIMEV